MSNTSKISTLEAKFPLLAVEHGCLVSKDADLTIAFKLELPELFTVTESEYEAMHSAWHKAIKVLPNYSIVHKQDWFIQESYAPELNEGELSFLARASERHFNERPYLHHAVYLFLTKTTKKRMAQQSNFSALCRGHLIPKDIEDKEAVAKFLEAVDQFERIINDRIPVLYHPHVEYSSTYRPTVFQSVPTLLSWRCAFGHDKSVGTDWNTVGR